MNIKLKSLKIRDIVDGFKDNAEEGVVGYGGKLDIRPAYQKIKIAPSYARSH